MEVAVRNGERVVVLRTSAMVGRRGKVVTSDTSAARVWVLLDGERLPMAFATFEIVRAEESSPHMGIE